MTYKIIFSNFAYKQLSKLPLEVQTRIISTIKRCRIRPYAHVKKLIASNYFRLRIGNYRVIMDIVDNKLIIYILLMEC